jgi:hypothetical protein
MVFNNFVQEKSSKILYLTIFVQEKSYKILYLTLCPPKNYKIEELV